MQKSKISNLAGAVGVFGGIFYAMNKRQGFTNTALYAVGFGLVGYVIGNAVSKFYE